MSIHSKNEDVILQFGLKKPAFRICVNTPTTHGSIGLTTGLDPAMTLGCGGWGGNITSDNISPRHLLNIKRLAYEVRPAVRTTAGTVTPSLASSFATAGGSGTVAASSTPGVSSGVSSSPRLPKPPARVEAGGIPAQTLAARIDSFLESRGYRIPADTGVMRDQTAPAPETPAAFVCEDDVRAALKAGRKVVIDEKTIVTPSARDLGESQKVFIETGWPR